MRRSSSLSAPPARKVIKAEGRHVLRGCDFGLPHRASAFSARRGTALTVSTMMHGEYGVDDVCLSHAGHCGPQRRPRQDSQQAHRRRARQAAEQCGQAQGRYRSQTGTFTEERSRRWNTALSVTPWAKCRCRRTNTGARRRSAATRTFKSAWVWRPCRVKLHTPSAF